jgi:hypothetical protein
MGSRTTTVEDENMEEGVVTEDSATAESTQCVLNDSETQRMEQDQTIVENTQNAEEHKVVESTRETKQKREHENLSEEPDVEGTIDQTVKITMNKEESQVRQKSIGRMMITEDTQKKSRSEDDYVSDRQERSLEQMEVRSLQSEDESAPTVQAPSPKRPKKLKVERQGENPQEGRSRTRASSLKT